MKIIRLKSGRTLPSFELTLRERYFISTDETAPAWLSAFTAMKLAKAVDKTGATAIEIGRTDDIIAAISARKLTKTAGVKIIVNLPSDFPTPLSLPGEYIREVDLWVFPSERMRAEYADLGQLKRSEVIFSTCFDEKILAAAETQSCEKKEKPASADSLTYLVILRPQCDTVVMNKIIDTVDAADRDIRVLFLGQSRAGEIMPVIRHSRNTLHPERYEWLGDNYDLAGLLSAGATVIKAGKDITSAEAAAPLFGASIIETSQINRQCGATGNLVPAPMTPDNYVRQLAHAIQKL